MRGGQAGDGFKVAMTITSSRRGMPIWEPTRIVLCISPLCIMRHVGKPFPGVLQLCFFPEYPPWWTAARVPVSCASLCHVDVQQNTQHDGRRASWQRLLAEFLTGPRNAIETRDIGTCRRENKVQLDAWSMFPAVPPLRDSRYTVPAVSQSFLELWAIRPVGAGAGISCNFFWELWGPAKGGKDKKRAGERATAWGVLRGDG